MHFFEHKMYRTKSKKYTKWVKNKIEEKTDCVQYIHTRCFGIVTSVFFDKIHDTIEPGKIPVEIE